MRRFLAYLLAVAVLLPPVPAGALVDEQPTPWWFKGLVLHVPFDDPASPLKTIRGSGAFTFSRVHDATHTATYIHPGTGLLTVADNNQLRIEAGGALIERAARTNICLSSQSFGDLTYWSQAICSVDNNAGAAPDGTITADKQKPNTGANAGFQQNHVGTVSAATAYTFSVFAKDGDFHWMRLSIWDGSNNYAWFNLSTGAVGTVGAGVTARISGPVNGYYRCSVTFTMVGTDMYVNFGAVDGDNSTTVTGDGSKGNLFWGAQVEQGLFPSSYIPTTTATMTRNADSLTYPIAPASLATAGWISAQVDIAYADTGGHWRLVDFSANRPALAHQTGNVQYTFDGTQAVTGSAWTTTASRKIASSWGGTTMKLCMDGGTVTTGAFTSGSWIGANMTFGNAATEFFHIRNLLMGTALMSNTEIQAISR